MFSKILIANRGEIAVRIIRACKEMGIATVSVYSEADKDALHVALADEQVCIGPAHPKDSYLNMEQILSAALLTGAQAIHPGYGFLSENADFARLCRKNGIVFIGPNPDLMDKIADKTAVKQYFQKTNLVPIPGTKGLSGVEEAVKKAAKIGYPVMLKAAMGGGGRGIRRIENEKELRLYYPLSEAESESAFGDKSLYIEKLIYPAKHIEVQILADEAGNVVCLGDRDCSVQKAHQKLIEETPSPGVDKKQRAKLIKDCIEAVKGLSYTGVGTLEFLLDKDGRFWFMEMNVRLQVEHCVTEMLTRVDLVKWQIRTAAGVPLGFKQKDIPMADSSIECRINALAPGHIDTVLVPGGPFVRFDTWMTPDSKISPYYDALLGKLIVSAATREETLRKMKSALCELLIVGVQTNIEEQLSILSNESFIDGTYDTTIMGDE